MHGTFIPESLPFGSSRENADSFIDKLRKCWQYTDLNDHDVTTHIHIIVTVLVSITFNSANGVEMFC